MPLPSDETTPPVTKTYFVRARAPHGISHGTAALAAALTRQGSSQDVRRQARCVCDEVVEPVQRPRGRAAAAPLDDELTPGAVVVERARSVSSTSMRSRPERGASDPAFVRLDRRWTRSIVSVDCRRPEKTLALSGRDAPASARRSRSRAGRARRRRSRATSPRGGRARRGTPRRLARREQLARRPCSRLSERREELRRRRASARAPRGARRRRAARSACASGRPATFSTRKWRSARLAICGRCVIVTTCARSASRRSVSPTACAVCAADAGVDLVEHHRLAAADGGDRERDARELAAGGGLGDRRERQARVRPDQEEPPRRRRTAPGSRSRELDAELALAEPDAVRARARPPRRSAAPPARRAVAQRGVDAVDLGLRGGERRSAAAAGSWPSSSASSSARASPPRVEQLARRSAPRWRRRRSAIRSSSRLDLLEPARLGLERVEERAQVGRRLAQRELRRRGASSPARCELGREALERRDGPLGGRDEVGRALSVVGRERAPRPRRRLARAR